ncbi:MAG: ATP-binding cassette domain-containing protein [Nevskia sp.]
MSDAQTGTGISTHGLVRGYGSGAERRVVVSDLSLRCRPGELTLIMGASGSGKSTLLAMIGGLLRPEAGEVEILGTRLGALTPAALERFRFEHLGFIFQGFNLFAALTAVEQVAIPLRFGGVPAPEARLRALTALDEVGLSGRAGLRPAQMSGGEKQRVAIARALAGRRSILLADEPTSSLDSANGELVTALLRRVAVEHGATVVVVTHDPKLKHHGDQIIELSDGRVISAVAPIPVPAMPTGVTP